MSTSTPTATAEVATSGVPDVLAKADLSILTSNSASQAYTGPYGGVPAFDQVTVADLEPALEAAMKKGLIDINAISRQTAAPTFENTIAAMERAGGGVATREQLLWHLLGHALHPPRSANSRSA